MKRILMLILTLCLLVTSAASASEIIDYVQKALDEANHLTRTNCFLTEDGAILTAGNDMFSEQAEYIAAYSALSNIRKLEALPGGMILLALTEDGELYLGDQNLAENVLDVTLPARINDGVIYIEGGFLDFDHETAQARTSSSISFRRMDNGSRVEFDGSYASSSVSNAFYHWLVDDEGHAFIIKDSSAGLLKVEPYASMDFHNWSDLALFRMAMIGDVDHFSDTVEEITCVGIQKDGTVLACGDRAEEVLSWGPIAYVDEANGNIVGLRPDGTLKLTGPDVGSIVEIAESWTDIAAVRFMGKPDISVYDIAIAAMTTDGRFYHLEGRLLSDGQTDTNFSEVHS